MTDDPTDDLADSVADQLAAEIRRRRHAAGLTQRELGRRSGYSREYVLSAEKPGNIPSRDFVQALDTALGADGALLELRARAKSEQQSLREGFLADDQLDVPAHTFVVAGVANGLFLRRSDVSESATVSPMLAHRLQLVATVYREAYSTVPARQLFGAVRELFNLVLSLRPGDQPPHLRKLLLTTAGEMAALAMPLLGLNLRRWTEAGQYLEIAFQASREADNIDLETIVWACRAFHAAYGNSDLSSGSDFADEAITTGRTGATATTRGWVAAVASERYADLGDSTMSLQRLEQARVELSGDDERPWSGMGTFDDAKLVAYEGGNYSRLQRYEDAVRLLDLALRSLDGSMRRHRCTAFIDRAEAHAAGGGIDAACDDTRDALALAVETQHADTIWRAKRLVRPLLSSGGTAMRQLWQEVLAAQAATAEV